MSDIRPARHIEQVKRSCHYTTQSGICGKPTEYCYHVSETGRLYLCAYHYGVIMAAISRLHIEQWPDERG